MKVSSTTIVATLAAVSVILFPAEAAVKNDNKSKNLYYGSIHIVPRKTDDQQANHNLRGRELQDLNKLDGSGIKESCTPDDLCGLCQGDCNTHEDCEGDLICFQKERGEPMAIPGCLGKSSSTTDWCVPPETDFEIMGTVFEDINRNGVQDDNEPGVADVMVSDGTHVVLTADDGSYVLPAPTVEYEQSGFAVMMTVPDGYSAPLSSTNIPQFFYIHKPWGTPNNLRGEPFRYGGLAPTGPLPEQINFPLTKTEPKPQFKFIVSGDPQTYSNTEIGYLRDTVIKEIIEMDDLEGILFEGDIMGDELSLYNRMREVIAVADMPQYYAPGNHDFDFDSTSVDHSFDTFRREFGPEYYSFEIGQVHFVVLDDVRYPCFSDVDNLDGLHDFCNFPDGSDYNGVIPERQLEWLKNDLANVPEDKLVFLHLHIPINSFIDQNLIKHMVDNAVDLYEAVGCSRDSNDGTFKAEKCARPVVSASAHTHTCENILPGEVFEGWSTILDASETVPAGRAPGATPFHQVILGAASGSWWSGDFDSSSVPESYQRLGSPKGYYIFEFDGPNYQETFKATGKPLSEQMHVDILTPDFTLWYKTLANWTESGPGPNDVPPLNIHDLPDTKTVLAAEKTDSLLTVNVWNGSRDHVVTVSFSKGDPIEMTRTQPGNGENILETLDVASLKRQMMVARFAYNSTSGEPRSNGYELFRFSVQCPSESGEPTACTARPLGAWQWADQSTHVWQTPIPDSLHAGVHTAKITATDQYGRDFHSSLVFEIVESDERPPKFFKDELWEQFP